MIWLYVCVCAYLAYLSPKKEQGMLLISPRCVGVSPPYQLLKQLTDFREPRKNVWGHHSAYFMISKSQ
jgi:hypothetical protein